MVYAVNILPFGRHLNDSVYPLFSRKAYKTVCFNNKAQLKTAQMLYLERFAKNVNSVIVLNSKVPRIRQKSFTLYSCYLPLYPYLVVEASNLKCLLGYGSWPVISLIII